MDQEWTKDESALIELATETARQGGHVRFLATLLICGPLWNRTHDEIVAEIMRRLTAGQPQGTITESTA